jgi:hypothetical protein
MAAEIPNIIEVKNDIIRVEMPYWEGAPTTYLTTSVAATGTSLTVKDNTGFAQNWYVRLGPIGNQQTEIKRITDPVTAGTSLTIAACTFSHPSDTMVALSRYDQVEIYGSSSPTDTNPTLIGSATNLDVSTGYTEIKAGTTYAYYYARFKDSNAGTYSSYSGAYAYTGLTNKARGQIKKEFLLLYNERIDDIITDEWMNMVIDHWHTDLIQRRRNWSCLRYQYNVDTVQDQQGYALPSDIYDNTSTDSIVSVKFYNHSAISYADQSVFQNLTYDHIGSTLSAAASIGAATLYLVDASDFATDGGTIHAQGQTITYTATSGNTLTGVSGVVADLAKGSEIWQTYTTGQPNTYTIDNGLIRIYPVPDSSQARRNITIDYWRDFTPLTSDASETLFMYPDNCHKFMYYMLSVRRKMPADEQLKREQLWRAELEELVAQDPDFRDIYIQPVNHYYLPY